MSDKKLGFTSDGLKDSSIYYRKIGSTYCFVYNPIAETLLEFIGYLFFSSIYIILSIGFVVIGIKTFTINPFDWKVLLFGVFLLCIGLKMIHNLFALPWTKIMTFGQVILLNNTHLIIIKWIPIPWVQIIKRNEIEEVDICIDKKETKKSTYRLKIKLDNQVRYKYSNFRTSKLIPQQELKDILLKNKQIHTLELADTVSGEVHIETKSYQLNWSTKQLFSPWEEIFSLIAGCLALICIVYFLFYNNLLAWGICTLLVSSFLFRIIYELIDIWQVKEVLITPFLIKQVKTRTPFLKDYQIKKQDIALLSTIAIEQNRCAIQVISQSGDIHQLPINFESEKEAQKQLTAMKQMLRLE